MHLKKIKRFLWFSLWQILNYVKFLELLTLKWRAMAIDVKVYHARNKALLVINEKVRSSKRFYRHRQRVVSLVPVFKERYRCFNAVSADIGVTCV